MAKIIVVDERRCLGCKSCELECALAHGQADSLVEALAAEELLQPRVRVEPLRQRPRAEPGQPPPGSAAMPLQCQHCQDAPCILACPSEAIRRLDEDAPVLIDAQRCIGCKFCLMVCPFGMIELSRDGKAMIKCDLCVQRVEAGREPACVSACPTGALQFVELDEYLRQRRRQAAARVAEIRAGG
jgi:carbon-monoxide dehydrogenase iron sulfur subunit